MFNNVLCSASHATIGVAALATARPPIASGIGDNSAEIEDNSAEIGNNSVKISDDSAEIGDRRERDPMLNSLLNGDWSNSVPGRQVWKKYPYLHD